MDAVFAYLRPWLPVMEGEKVDVIAGVPTAAKISVSQATVVLSPFDAYI